MLLIVFNLYISSYFFCNVDNLLWENLNRRIIDFSSLLDCCIIEYSYF